MIDRGFVEQFEQNGYTVARGLFSPQEVASYRDHFMTLRAAGSYPGDTAGVDVTSNDPLKRFPRMIHMHRWDEVSLHWLLDERLIGLEEALDSAHGLATPRASGVGR